MKIVLAAINAKYIHSNLGVHSLKAYGEQELAKRGRPDIRIEIGEYTINHQTDHILQDIYKRKPDMVGFSCYIWNITYVRQLAGDLVKVLPKVRIWLGGPEVSYDAETILAREPAVEGVMVGEGERTFAELILTLGQKEGRGGQGGLEDISGIVFRDSLGQIKAGPTKAWRKWNTGSSTMKAAEGVLIHAATVCPPLTEPCGFGVWSW